MIRSIAQRAVAAHIGCVYKKTDSALRGNIGAERSAVLDGSGEKCLSFIPALPGMNRITVGGVHYIDGVPVGSERVRPGSLRAGDGKPGAGFASPAMRCAGEGNLCPEELDSFRPGEEKCIYLFDCASREDMEREARKDSTCWAA